MVYSSDHLYDRSVNGQCHIYVKPIVCIFNTTKVSEYGYDLGVKAQGQIFLKSVKRLVTRALLSFYGGGYSYLTQ